VKDPWIYVELALSGKISAIAGRDVTDQRAVERREFERAVDGG